MTEDIHEIRVRKEYAAIKGFYAHFLVFVPIMLLLAVIDVVAGSGMWVHWVGFGWGIGLALHGYAAFVLKPRELAAWEQTQSHAAGGRA